MRSSTASILLSTVVGSLLVEVVGRSAGFLAVREALIRRGGSGLWLADSVGLDKRLKQSGLLGYEDVVRAKSGSLEAELSPLFELAPKDSSGSVDAKTARYILHRLFVRRHAWYVTGIEEGGAAHDDSKTDEALLKDDRFELKDLAHFAATVEALILAESAERLQQAFDAVGVSRDDALVVDHMHKIFEAYLVIFLFSNEGIPWTNVTNYSAARNFVVHTYPTFNDALAGMLSASNIVSAEGAGAPSLWQHCLQILEHADDQLGKTHDKDCRDLKSTLMDMEMQGLGRVPLHAFWGPLLNESQWYFYESEPYLRQLGAIYEEEGSFNSVLIANYLSSEANCAAGTQFYDLCCANECEDILRAVEVRIGALSAAPELLANVLASVPSSTVSAPRQLSESLTRRLYDIASRSEGGEVHLHGRLFAQVLHHSYPRECPLPHVKSSSLADAPTRLSRRNRGAFVGEKFVAEYIEKFRSQPRTLKIARDVPWSNEEQLFLQNV